MLFDHDFNCICLLKGGVTDFKKNLKNPKKKIQERSPVVRKTMQGRRGLSTVREKEKKKE